jgi:hypothetical protein
MYNLEYIVDTGNNLYIRTMGVHEIAAVREIHQFVAARILRQVGVILVAKVTPKGVHGEIFTPLQLFDKWDTVEEFAVEIPRKHHRGIAVVEELHIVDQTEHLLLADVRKVGQWMNEQHVRNLIPLDTSLKEEVDLSPAVHPEALVELGLGKVRLILAS